MDIIASFFICFVMFVIGAIKGVFVGFTLSIALIIFILLSLFRGFKLGQVLKMVYDGGKKVLLVLEIFVLIGAIISVWMASGTVQSIVYYGLKYINGNLFILSAFIITAAVSVLIGTSFGTVGTAGVALMVMARSGNVNTSAAAGAIIAGAYFGDRCSPMSSSANLVAHITGTELYVNIRNMIRTSIVPIILSVIAYGAISLRYPMSAASVNISNDIAQKFDVGFIALVPAIIILMLSIVRVNVKLSMLISIAAAAVISVIFQHNSILDTLKFVISGYSVHGDSYVTKIISGGGITSMLKVSIVVFISSGFTGIFESTKMLKGLEVYIKRLKGGAGTFLATILVSIMSAAFGCTQVMAVMLTDMLMKESYKANNETAEEVAVNLENTAIVIAPLIPWNIAVLVPLTSMGVGIGAIPFSIYLFLLPAWNLFVKTSVFRSIRLRFN